MEPESENKIREETRKDKKRKEKKKKRKKKKRKEEKRGGENKVECICIYVSKHHRSK